MKKMSFDNYIQGNRKGMSAHDLERLSQEDPFLADAIDGFDLVEGDHAASIAKMRRQIEIKSVSSKKQTLMASMYWRSIAVCAVLAFLVGGGYLLMLDERDSSKQYSTASIETESIRLYVPQKYIEKKDDQIMKGEGLKGQPVQNIENLEILNVERDLYIYKPKDYESKTRKAEVGSRLEISNIKEVSKN